MINTSSGTIDLEDAKIIDVTRQIGEICIYFHSVRLWQNIDDNSRNFKSIEKVKIRLIEIIEEHCSGSDSSPHVDKHQPVDVVEVVTYKNKTLELQGFRNRTPWYLWSITADHLNVEYGNE
jgi:hypothetical protein